MIRRRTETERAIAFLRRLSEPREEAKREKAVKVWPEPGAIRMVFEEARRVLR